MQNAATLIAHIMFRHGTIMNISTVLRTLDEGLETASNGAYALTWDSDNLMVADFARTQVVLVAGHEVTPQAGFTMTIAVSPKDEDAIADPTLAPKHRALILDLVNRFAHPWTSNGVFWQRAAAPITAEAVERIAEGLEGQLALMKGAIAKNIARANRIDTAETLHLKDLTPEPRAVLV